MVETTPPDGTDGSDGLRPWELRRIRRMLWLSYAMTPFLVTATGYHVYRAVTAGSLWYLVLLGANLVGLGCFAYSVPRLRAYVRRDGSQ